MKGIPLRNISIFTFFLITLSSCVSHKELITFRDAKFPFGVPEDIINRIDIL